MSHDVAEQVSSFRVVAPVVLVLALLGGAVGSPAAAQELPACDGASVVSDCVLPSWPDGTLRDAPGLFGPADGVSGVWIVDDTGDVAPAGLDIIAVGVSQVDIGDATDIRESPDLLRLGKPAKAVKDGAAVLVRIVLDRPLDQIEAGHASVHVATDIDGARSNNAPTGVGQADGPFAGVQDIYSLTYATTTGKTRLLNSDLAKGWYKGKDSFAASWAAPNVLDVLVRPQAFGQGVRVVTFVSGNEGGYDSVTLGPSAIPVDGRVGLLPTCTEGSISTDPFIVRRLVENGQTLRNIEAPASWLGGATFPVDGTSRASLQALIAANDEDGDGVAGLASTVSLFEDGLVTRQRPEVDLALAEGGVQLAIQLGLTRRGYNVLRNISLKLTGDAVADAYLERAAKALVESTPSFRSAKKAGLVNGVGIGACVSSLIAPPPTVVAAVDETPAQLPDDDAADGS